MARTYIDGKPSHQYRCKGEHKTQWAGTLEATDSDDAKRQLQEILNTPARAELVDWDYEIEEVK